MLSEESAESRTGVEACHILDFTDVEVKLMGEEISGMAEAVAVDELPDGDVAGILADGLGKINMVRAKVLGKRLTVEVRFLEDLLLIHQRTELSVETFLAVELFVCDKLFGRSIQLFVGLLSALDGIVEDTVLLPETGGVPHIEEDGE